MCKIGQFQNKRAHSGIMISKFLRKIKFEQPQMLYADVDSNVSQIDTHHVVDAQISDLPYIRKAKKVMKSGFSFLE